VKRRLMIAATFALAAKLVLAFVTYGTNDVLTWEADLHTLKESGERTLYIEGSRPTWPGNSTGVRQQFNHPPFMIHVLQAGAAIAETTGLPFRTWLRVACAVADIAMLWLVCGILRAERIAPDASSLVAVALSPASILISGFHGNTDPIMVCFLVLSIYLIVTGRPAWLAGAAFGLAISIKIVPILFLLLVLLSLSSVRRSAAFILSAAAVFLLGSMPYLAREPMLVMRNVLGYTPGAGLWGFPLLAVLISEQAHAGYLAIARYAVPGAVLLATLWMHFHGPDCPLFLRCGFAVFLLLFLAPGFGLQYLVWLVPWSAALPWKSARWHHAIVGADLILFYGAFSRWRWDLANTFDYAPPAIPFVGMLNTLCWISVGAVALTFGLLVSGGTKRSPLLSSGLENPPRNSTVAKGRAKAL
jgi:hypothetical protein